MTTTGKNKQTHIDLREALIFSPRINQETDRDVKKEKPKKTHNKEIGIEGTAGGNPIK